jgi:two-component system KDP operon response regulator KdpE
MTSVLIIDDEAPLRRTLGITLKARKYEVLVAASGGEGLTIAAATKPDLVILDLGLPDMDGTTVVLRLRAWTDVPILVLSGRSDSSDKVEALDAGADDYVTKPFETDELLARLRAVSRRSATEDEEPTVELGDVIVDLAAHRISRGSEAIHLTPTEWHLLEVLIRNPGRLLRRRWLLAEVWGPGYESAHGNLRLYMAQLRQKIEAEPSSPQYLLTEPGMGYRYDPRP